MKIRKNKQVKTIFLILLSTTGYYGCKQIKPTTEVINLDQIERSDSDVIKQVFFTQKDDTFKYEFSVEDGVLTLNIYKGDSIFSNQIKTTQTHIVTTDLGIGNNQIRQDYYGWDEGIFASRYKKIDESGSYRTLGGNDMYGRAKYLDGIWSFDFFIRNDTVNVDDSLKIAILQHSNAKKVFCDVFSIERTRVIMVEDTLLSHVSISEDYQIFYIKFKYPGVYDLYANLTREVEPYGDVIKIEGYDSILGKVVVIESAK